MTPQSTHKLLAIGNSDELRLPDWPTNFLHSVALFRADWLCNLAIRSSYQGWLTLQLSNNLLAAIRSFDASWLTSQLTNKIHVIGSSYQSSLTPQSTKNSLLSVVLIRADWLPNPKIKVIAIRSSLQRTLTPWLTNKLLVIRSSCQSWLTPQLTKKLLVIRSTYQSWLTP